jgi:hypothetical protein
MRRSGLRRTSPSCRSFCAELRLTAVSNARAISSIRVDRIRQSPPKQFCLLFVCCFDRSTTRKMPYTPQD